MVMVREQNKIPKNANKELETSNNEGDEKAC
jgi:hypothetical protein